MVDFNVNNGTKPVYKASVVDGDATVVYEGWSGSDGTVSYSSIGAYNDEDTIFKTFKEGVTYTYIIRLAAKDGYVFTDNTKVQLNELRCSGVQSKNHQIITFRKVYSSVSVCEHVYKKNVTKPTCIKEGFTTNVCKYCGYSYVNCPTEKTAHKYSKITKKATCTTPGRKVYTCKDCNYSYVETIPAKGHILEQEVTVASEDEYGMITYTCTECDKDVKKVTIPKIKSVKLSSYSYTYTGKEKRPSVKVTDMVGRTISSAYYNVEYYNNKNAGTAEVMVIFKGNYEGENESEFTIKKASQKISTKVSGKTYKQSLLKKKAQTFSIGASAKTPLSYKSGNKHISVSSKGKVTVKKGTPKGQYKIIISAKKSGNYKEAMKTVTIKVN